MSHTMCPCDLAPDHSNLRSSHLFLRSVDIGDALAKVEAGALGVIDTLDLDERCARVGVTLATLVRQVLAPVEECVSEL